MTYPYAKTIAESAPASKLQETAAALAKAARFWRDRGASLHHLHMAREYQQASAHWYLLARDGY
jgi:hypothetical protein